MGIQSTYVAPASADQAILAVARTVNQNSWQSTATYSSAPGQVTGTFTAPSSGTVFIKNHYAGPSMGTTVYYTWALTGATTVSASDANALVNNANQQTSTSMELQDVVKVTGLTPGGTYTITLYWKGASSAIFVNVWFHHAEVIG